MITDLSDEDALRFASSSAAQAVLDTAEQSGVDTILTLNGSEITLRNIDDASLERSGSEIIVTEPSSGPSQGDDTYTYRMSDGAVTISTDQEDATSGTQDRVVLTDLDLSDVEFRYVGGDLQIAWVNGAQSGTLNIAEGGQHIESFEFADGSVLNSVNADFLARRATNPIADDERDILNGSENGDTITGTDGTDFIYGLGGDDTLDAGGTAGGFQYLYGGQGNDTYQYGRESGQVFIHAETATSGTADRLVFTDLNLSDVSFSTLEYSNPNIGDALRILWNDGSNSGEVRLTLEGQHIESFEFADGSVISGVNADFLARRASNPIANDERDTLNGSDAGEKITGTDGTDRIYGLGGDDTLDAGGTAGGFQYLYGGDGNDTYQYGTESGQVFIHAETATSGTADRLVFTDLNLSDVSFSTVTYNNPNLGEALRIQWNNGSDSGEVRLSLGGQHIESFEFADGSVLSSVDADFFAHRATNPIANDERDILNGSENGDTITGTNGTDRIYGLGGDDTLDAGGTAGGFQYLYGGDGNDTYQYGTESGQVFIHTETATSGNADRLIFTDLNLADVSFSSVTYNNPNLGEALRIQWTDGSDSGEVRLSLGGQHIESFEFADGSVLSYDELFA